MQETEARELLTRYHQDGDEAAFNAVYKVIDKKSRSMLADFKVGAEMQQELVQVAIVHILERMRDRGFIPNTPIAYAKMCCRNALLMHIRKEACLGDTEENPEESIESVLTPESEISDLANANLVFEPLSNEGLYIVYSRIVLRQKWARIGRDLALHRTTVKERFLEAMIRLAESRPSARARVFECLSEWIEPEAVTLAVAAAA
jgi:hypothetical protein